MSKKILLQKTLLMMLGKRLRWLFAFSVLVSFLSTNAFAQIYVENFDEEGYWIGENMGSYLAKSYENPGSPDNDLFVTNAAVREGSNVVSGYAWRLDDETGAFFRYQCNETVNGFTMALARWDNSPSPEFTIRYSTNSGESYTEIETLTGAWFDGDKTYKEYAHAFDTPIAPEAGKQVVIQVINVTGERILVDDFALYYGTAALIQNPGSFVATASSETIVDLSWTTNAAQNDVMVAWSDNETFGDPTGNAYTVGATIAGGGTVLYNGNETSYQHTGLTEGTTYYYKAWSVLSVAYSSGLAADATTPLSEVPALLFSEVADPDDNYNARFIELFNAGSETIDFDANTWYVAKQTNGGDYTDIQLTGTIAPGETYVLAKNQNDFEAAYPGVTAQIYHGDINHNGDDGYFLFKGGDHTSGVLIDAYGVQDVNGSDEAWECTDGRAVRNTDVIEPSATWTASEWAIAADPQGTPQNASDMTPGVHPDPVVPTIVINELMASNTTYQDPQGDTDDWIEIYNFGDQSVDIGGMYIFDEAGSVASDRYQIPTGDASTVIPAGEYVILWADKDTGDGVLHLDIKLSGSGEAVYLYDTDNETLIDHVDFGDQMDDVSYGRYPDHTGQFQLIFNSTPDAENVLPTVDNLTQLRSGTEGGTYKLTGEVILTYKQSYRGQKYLQDANRGILIDDNSGAITTSYNIGDGISNITGELGFYNGMTQFVPQSDPGDATSTGNDIPETVVTLSELKTNFNDYESMLVSILSVTFDDAGQTFGTGNNYDISDATDNAVFRTQFYDADYIDATIPAQSDIKAIAMEYNGTVQVCSRSASDISSLQSAPELVINELMASNETYLDPQGDADDWIEIYNAGTSEIDLGGMYITDEANSVASDRYQIPTGDAATVIPAGEYLVLWADKDESDGVLHIGIKLSGSGEAVYLYDTDNETLIDFVEFGEQLDDVSYGRYPNETGDFQKIFNTTPEAENVMPTAENVEQLRKGSFDAPYQLTGEAIITYQQSYRNKKYVQDATAGIEIDDPSGEITTEYNVNDGITGITGTLGEYNGMMQFTPTQNTATASSTGNDIPETEVTIAEFKADHEKYESMLLTFVDDVYFEDAGTTFENGNDYYITDGTETINFRTNFYSVSYIGTAIPKRAKIKAIGMEYKGTPQITSRSADDIEALLNNDATLESLTCDASNLVPDFAPDVYAYTMELPVGTTSTPTVTAIPNDMDAQMVISDATDISSTDEAMRTTTIDITAEDGTTTAQYAITFNVAEALSTDARLADIKVDGESIADFAPDTYAYTVELPTGTQATPTVTATTHHVNAQITMITDATDVTSTVAANRTTTIDVTAEDGTSVAQYTVLFNVKPEAQEDLFISEYIEGGGNNRALELYNPTSETIDLTQYVIKGSYNGSGWQDEFYTFPDGATLAPDEVYVIAHNEADDIIKAQADELLAYNAKGYAMSFTGDDARGLFKIDGDDYVLIDVVGIPTEQPSTGWDVAGVTTATANHTLVRKYPEITKGNTDWSASAGINTDNSEWEVLEQDDFSHLGWHSSPPPAFTYLRINEFMAKNETTIADGAGNYSDWVEIFNSSSEPVDIGGCYMADDHETPHQLPTDRPDLTVIPAGGYVLIWYDDGESTSTTDLHIPEKLSRDNGDAIYLYQPDGLTVIDSYAYTATQEPDQTTGRYPDGTNNWIVFSTPTPNAQNLPAVSIYDIQYTEADPADSPFTDGIVMTEGIVTGINQGEGYYIQSEAGAWNGIYVYDSGNTPAVGDYINIKGTVTEYFNLTEIKNISVFSVEYSGATLPEPVEVTATDLLVENGEPYEGVLVKAMNYSCLSVNYDGHGNSLFANEASDDQLIVFDEIFGDFSPTKGSTYNFTGICLFDYGEFKIAPRDANDVELLTNNPPVISSVANDPTDPVVGDDVEITAVVTDDGGIASAVLYYGVSSTAVTTSVTFDQYGFDPTNYKGTIPSQDEGTVYFRIEVTDTHGETTTYEGDYTVGPNAIGDVQSTEVNLYPNPVRNQLFVENINNVKQITISNILGQKVTTLTNIKTDKVRIETSHLENGVYIITLIDNNGKWTSKKFIKK